MKFQDQVVVITGAAQGIGAGCARVFSRAGGQVAILDIDAAAGEALATELNIPPGQARFYHCDVACTDSLRQTLERVATEMGRIDCLINNAGSHPPATAVEDTKLEDLDRLFRINFVSTFAAIQFALPHLRRTRGTIINMSSMTAVLGQDQSSAYAATKGAQLSLTKALAVELGPAGIRVNAVLPSNVDTPLMRSWAATLPDPESALQRVAGLQVLGRMAAPEEIGEVCLFLASSGASFVTGQGIEVEGGASLDY